MKPGLIIFALTVLGLIVRFATADWGGLSSDEANGVAIAVSGSWSDMVQHLKEDGNPPLVYVLIKLVSLISGDSDLAFRLISVGLAAALVPVSWLVTRALVGPAVAYQVALLVALCPPLVRYGNMVRMYSLLPILSLLSTYLAIRLIGRPASWPLRIAYCLLTALLIYCHHWGFLVAFGQVGLVAFGLVKRWWGWPAARPWGLSLALAGLLYVPWLPVLYYTLTHDESPWAVRPTLTHLFVDGPADALAGHLSLMNAASELTMVYAGIWMLFLLLFSGSGPSARLKAKESGAAGSAAEIEDGKPANYTAGAYPGGQDMIRCVVLFGLAAAFLLSAVKPAWRDRYLVAFSPMLLMLFCGSLKPFLARLPRPISQAIPLLIWLPVWIPQLLWLAAMPESSVWSVAEKIRREGDVHKDLVVVPWEAVAPAMSRVLPADMRMISFPEVERVRIIKWDGINQRIRDDRLMMELFDKMSGILSTGGTIWLIDSAHGTEPVAPPGMVPLASVHFLGVERIRMDQVRNWLNCNAEQQGPFVFAPGREVCTFLSTYRPIAAAQATMPAGPDKSDRVDKSAGSSLRQSLEAGPASEPLPESAAERWSARP